MRLSDEDRAILELLNDRGLSHEEIDELLGAGPGEARRRERAALQALGEEEAVEERPAPAAGESWPRWLRLAAGVVAAAAVGLGAGALVTGGSDEEPTESPSTAAEAPPEEVTIALDATEAGGQARGEAVVRLDDRFQPVLDLDLADLPPAPRGSIYVPWVVLDAARGIPIPAPIPVEAGAFRGPLDLAPQLISVLDVGRELEIVPLDRAELQELSSQVQAAGRGGGELALESPGGAVLSGPIPTE
jgi:hypothetical protein